MLCGVVNKQLVELYYNYPQRLCFICLNNSFVSEYSPPPSHTHLTHSYTHTDSPNSHTPQYGYIYSYASSAMKVLVSCMYFGTIYKASSCNIVNMLESNICRLVYASTLVCAHIHHSPRLATFLYFTKLYTVVTYNLICSCLQSLTR